MSTLDVLESSLLDLLFELEGTAIPLIIGGGFGLWLKRRYIGEGTRTMLNVLPGVRSTNDLDLFLRAEMVADLGRMKSVRETLDRLGYRPVEEAKYMQWVRDITRAEVVQEVKVDLLMGPPGPYTARLKINGPRVRPKGDSGLCLHAHLTPEAVGVEEGPVAVPLTGPRSTGEHFSGTVYLPQVMPYLIMKLFTFRDRKYDAGPRKDMGRHHAMDLYAIVAMTTEPEYEAALAWRDSHWSEAIVREAAEIVRSDFAGPESVGTLRLREHALYRPGMEVEKFLSVLAELFPGPLTPLR